MNTRIKKLRDLVVALDRHDRKLETMRPAAYRAAAAEAQVLTYDEMGLLPMSDFAGLDNALQNAAENIHFSANGRFADLDGTGRADEASVVTTALLGRIHEGGGAVARALSDDLMIRLARAATGTSGLSQP